MNGVVLNPVRLRHSKNVTEEVTLTRTEVIETQYTVRVHLLGKDHVSTFFDKEEALRAYEHYATQMKEK